MIFIFEIIEVYLFTSIFLQSPYFKKTAKFSTYSYHCNVNEFVYRYNLRHRIMMSIRIVLLFRHNIAMRKSSFPVRPCDRHSMIASAGSTYEHYAKPRGVMNHVRRLARNSGQFRV